MVLVISARSRRIRCMKLCYSCNTERPITDFYGHQAMTGGYLGKCKFCCRAATLARRVELAKDPIWAERELARQRDKSRRYRALGKVKKTPTDKKRAAIKRHKLKYPERNAARAAVARAVATGRLKRQSCYCGRSDSEAHHDDYSKPLDVLWLCPTHHAERHVQLRKLQRNH